MLVVGILKNSVYNAFDNVSDVQFPHFIMLLVGI